VSRFAFIIHLRSRSATAEFAAAHDTRQPDPVAFAVVTGQIEKCVLPGQFG